MEQPAMNRYAQAFAAPLAMVFTLSSPADRSGPFLGHDTQAGGVYEAVASGGRPIDPAAQRAIASAVFDAVKANDPRRVRALLDLDPALVASRDVTGRTPLHCAALGTSLPLLELLIDRGAKVNATDRQGWTPLHVAVNKGSCDLVGCLLNRGARLDARTATGQTAFNLADDNGDDRMKGLLGAMGRGIPRPR